MVTTGRARYTPHALVSTVVFEFMHIADELAGNWAPFRPFNEPLVATVGMGIFTLVALADCGASSRTAGWGTSSPLASGSSFWSWSVGTTLIRPT